MELTTGDRVKQKFTIANRNGTIIGLYNEDFYITYHEQRFLYAIKGEFKVNFDGNPECLYTPMSNEQLEKI